MTLRERLIISAYTGVIMCDFDIFQKYITEVLDRPVWTHELAFPTTWNELKEKVKPEFLKLCGNEDNETESTKNE